MDISEFLTGTKAQEVNLQNAYNNSPNDTTFVLPDRSKFPAGFQISSDLTKTMRWVAEGSADKGNVAPGANPIGPAQTWNNPVQGPADGDTWEQYTGGSYVVSKWIQKNPLNKPMRVFNFINDRSVAASGNNQMIVLNGVVKKGALGNVYPLQININSAGDGGYGTCDVPLSTACIQTGTNWGWGAVFLMADVSGLGSGTGTAKYGLEVDLYASGAEQAGYWFDEKKGTRNGMLLRFQRWTGGLPWIANHLYATGDIIQQVTIAGVQYNAQATTTGMSGAATPAWILGTGTKLGFNSDGTPSLIVDGGVSWQLKTTMNAQHAYGHRVTTDPGVSVGAAYTGDATVDNCVLDCSTFVDNHPQGKGAAIRFRPGQVLDLSAGIAYQKPVQNARTFGYNPTTKQLEYTVNGIVMFSIGDNGKIGGEGYSS